MERRKPVALVTGAASGIGRCTVLRLAQQGYDVVINYSASEARATATAPDAEEVGAETLVLQADVSNDHAVRAMLDEIKAHFGRLDALVNNAGTTTTTPPADLEGLTAEEWDRVFAVNVRGSGK